MHSINYLLCVNRSLLQDCVCIDHSPQVFFHVCLFWPIKEYDLINMHQRRDPWTNKVITGHRRHKHQRINTELVKFSYRG